MEGPGKKNQQGNEVQSISYKVEVEKADGGAQHLPGNELQSSRTKKKKEKEVGKVSPTIGDNRKTRPRYSMAAETFAYLWDAQLPREVKTDTDESFEATAAVERS